MLGKQANIANYGHCYTLNLGCEARAIADSTLHCTTFALVARVEVYVAACGAALRRGPCTVLESGIHLLRASRVHQQISELQMHVMGYQTSQF